MISDIINLRHYAYANLCQKALSTFQEAIDIKAATRLVTLNNDPDGSIPPEHQPQRKAELREQAHTKPILPKPAIGTNSTDQRYHTPTLKYRPGALPTAALQPADSQPDALPDAEPDAEPIPPLPTPRLLHPRSPTLSAKTRARPTGYPSAARIPHHKKSTNYNA